MAQRMVAQRLVAQRLVDWFEAAKPYVVALSGGVDSAVVAAAGHRSPAEVLAVTARSPSVAERELSDALQVVESLGIPHAIVDTSEIDDPRYRVNDVRRCYYCKSQLFAAIRSKFPQAIIVTGTNLDDLSDYRPGLVAADENQVRAPLAELGIDKRGVRQLAELWSLHLADKPASPCLASRLAHGVAVTPQRLAMVEQAEAVIAACGIREFRVRFHDGELARIEVGASDLEQLVVPETRAQISQALHQIGFRFVTLDLDGFRSGSLNPVFQIKPAAK